MSFNECSNLMLKYNLGENNQSGFFNFVFKKISRDTKNRFVVKDDNSINIIPFNSENIKVIPIWKDLDKDNLDIQNEIDEASDMIMNGDVKCIYYVYPKNEKFTKHIQIKTNNLESACREYVIKLIPYSLKNNIRKCNGNSNILCK